MLGDHFLIGLLALLFFVGGPLGIREGTDAQVAQLEGIVVSMAEIEAEIVLGCAPAEFLPDGHHREGHVLPGGRFGHFSVMLGPLLAHRRAEEQLHIVDVLGGRVLKSHDGQVGSQVGVEHLGENVRVGSRGGNRIGPVRLGKGHLVDVALPQFQAPVGRDDTAAAFLNQADLGLQGAVLLEGQGGGPGCRARMGVQGQGEAGGTGFSGFGGQAGPRVAGRCRPVEVGGHAQVDGGVGGRCLQGGDGLAGLIGNADGVLADGLFGLFLAAAAGGHQEHAGKGGEDMEALFHSSMLKSNWS